MALARLRSESESGHGAVNVASAVQNRQSQEDLMADKSEIYHGRILLPDGEIHNMPVAERFRLLRARIERHNLSGHNDRLISVTSAVPEEGKSVCSVNLARAFATNPTGKTLLLDCDLRKPAVHKYFGLRTGPGLSDALVSNAAIASFAYPITRGLDVVPAGTLVEDPLWLIDNDSFVEQLRALRQIYDYIIVDCPPVLLCPEPVRISSITDGTLMVVRGWVTERRLVKDALDIIERKKMIGVVINGGTDSSRQYRYYRYYGYVDHQRETKRSVHSLSRAKRAVNEYKRRVRLNDA
jgi:capsular exopolysaccharide synthesis family protein